MAGAAQPALKSELFDHVRLCSSEMLPMLVEVTSTSFAMRIFFDAKRYFHSVSITEYRKYICNLPDA
jgi:hypothetical protein